MTNPTSNDAFPEWNPSGKGSYDIALGTLQDRNPLLAGTIERIVGGLYAKSGTAYMETSDTDVWVRGLHTTTEAYVSVRWRSGFRGRDDYWVTASLPDDYPNRRDAALGANKTMDISYEGRLGPLLPSPVATIRLYNPPYGGDDELVKILQTVAKEAGISRVRYETIKGP